MKSIKSIWPLFIALSIVLFSACKKSEDDERTIEYGSVTDVEGNVYKTVKIGEQWWMAENLKVSTFNDGTQIGFLSIDDSDSTWAAANGPLYTVIIDSIYGYLYNGFVVSSEKNIAPTGWHIASDDDWKILESELGMNENEINQTGWRGQSEAEMLATKYAIGWPEAGELYGMDEFGFEARPGGCRIVDGRTNTSSSTAFWWTNTKSGNEIWYRYIDAYDKRIFRQHTYTQYGMSIRCVKD